MGEVAAAVVAGALSTHDGVRMICRRSALLTRIAGSGSNLAYVTLGDQFGPALAGRAQTSLNLLLFLAAALLQSGIGWALDLLNAMGFGAVGSGCSARAAAAARYFDFI